MAGTGHDETPEHPLDRAFRSTIGRESTTFGFSIMVTVTFGVLQSVHGIPESRHLLLYGAAASLSFTLLEALLSRFFRKPMPQHRTQVMSLGTALNVVSVLLAVMCALGVATVAPRDVAWAAAPFTAATVYLVVEGLEVAWAEWLLRRRGDPHAADVEA